MCSSALRSSDPGVPVLKADGLVRRFGSATALAGVSLEVPRGEFFSLLGPSGCGKTTLLRLIAGLDQPDEGTLFIAGQDASTLPAHRRPVNTVFQSYALFPHLTVWDNVAFGLRMKRVHMTEVTRRVGEVLEMAAISGLACRKPAQLSGGEKQRVALARAVVNEPELLLLDEPLAALDLKLRKQLQGELHALQRRLGTTFIYVTHDQEEALAMSDRIAVMNAGRFEQVGTAESLYEQPRNLFVARFLGGCNLFSATIESQERDGWRVNTALGRWRLAAPLKTFAPGTRVTLAVRHEHLALSAAAPAQGMNSFAAEIVDLVYAGPETRYRLRAGAETIQVSLMNTPHHLRFAEGQKVWCHAAPESVVLLED